MVYQRRKQSELDIYHVMVRGAGRQLIFDDEEDRKAYLSILAEVLSKLPLELYAWCLMDNHAHFLLYGELKYVSQLMQELGRRYSRRFNDRHDRVGHLLQGRFKSVPVTSEDHLLTVLRYIHRNPVDAGLSSSCVYPWSSYGEYVGLSTRSLVETGAVSGLFDSARDFEDFHSSSDREGDAVLALSRASFMGDDEARKEFRRVLAKEGFLAFPVQDKRSRDRLICVLRARGLTIRQIGLLTGVGRNIIARAK